MNRRHLLNAGLALASSAALPPPRAAAAARRARPGMAGWPTDVDWTGLSQAVGVSGEERQRLYHEVQEEIIGQAYAVPLYVAAYQLGASKTLHGISWATNAKPNFYDAWLSP